MPIRMKETDRVRDKNRMVLLLENCQYHGYVVCEYCGEVTHTPQIDHYHARNNGGAPKALENCIVACPSCNGRKCDRSTGEVFGADVAVAIERRLATRVFTAEQWEAARVIYRLSRQTEKRIEMIYNWVHQGKVGE